MVIHLTHSQWYSFSNDFASVSLCDHFNRYVESEVVECKIVEIKW